MCDFYFKYFKKELIIIIWNKYNKRTTKIWGYFGSNAVQDEPRREATDIPLLENFRLDFCPSLWKSF